MSKRDAKANAVNYLCRQIRDNNLNYADLAAITKAAREKTSLKREKQHRSLPVLLTAEELNAFFDVASKEKKPHWELMFRLLLCTTLRVKKFAQLETRLIYISETKMFVEKTKNKTDRYVPFLNELRLPIRQQMLQSDKYLFESSPGKPYSVRAIQKKMKEIAKKAGIKKKVYPHLFRHQTITFLLKSGMQPQKVKLISGHQSIKNLEWYEHLTLGIAIPEYQEIMAGRR